MAWIKYNANPKGKQVGDCTVRAIAKATDQPWEDAYSGMAVQGFMMFDMPSANHVWGSYLKRNGFQRHMIPDTCPDCYTVKDFCRDNPKGTFIVALHGHVIAVKDGDYFDTWDSGEETPIYYFERK
jgi:hypothetical protein